MKVTLQKDYRSIYTLEELDQAKAVIAYEKENDEEKVTEWARMAAENISWHTYNRGCERVLEAEARTAKNCKVWDAYGEGTGQMDVWIEGIAKTTEGILEFGAYLTDIWMIDGSGVIDNWHIRYTRA